MEQKITHKDQAFIVGTGSHETKNDDRLSVVQRARSTTRKLIDESLLKDPNKPQQHRVNVEGDLVAFAESFSPRE